MTDIFISYSRDDETIGHEIYTALKDSGRDLWMDWASVPLTAEWWTEIKQGIEVADQFMFLVSPSSVASPICNLELDYARSLNKRVIPVEVLDTDGKTAHIDLMHKSLTDYQIALLNGRDLLLVARDNWRLLETHNRVKFCDGRFATNFRKLLEAIETDIECVKSHTRLLIRAQDWERRNLLPDALLYGEDLVQAEAWLEQSSCKEPLPLKIQMQYIEASRRAENERIRRVNEMESIIRQLAEKDEKIQKLELELLRYQTSAGVRPDSAQSSKKFRRRPSAISENIVAAKRTYRVFLSCSHSDTAIANRIRATLLEYGIQIWQQAANHQDAFVVLDNGSFKLRDGLQKALDSVDCVVVVLTPNHANSQSLIYGIYYALENNTPVFPVLAEGSPSESIPLRLATVQWLDIRNDYDAALLQLNDAITHKLNS